MSEQQQENQTQETVTSDTPKVPDGYVSKADLDRALADLHKFKNEAIETKGKLKSFEEKALAEKEDWKSLAERHKQEAEEYKTESQRIKDSYLGEKKYTAVRDAALKLGMRPEALSDLDLLSLDGVVIETTSTGKVNVLGADGFIQNLKTMKPHWFGQTQVTTNVNPGVPGVKGDSSKAITEGTLLKLSEEAQKSGDYSQYRVALAKFRSQT